MLISTSKFFKGNKIAQARGAPSNCTANHVLLVNNLHEKCITESPDGQNFGSTCTICNLHSLYNFALVLCVFVFSQSDTHFLFHVYIISVTPPIFRSSLAWLLVHWCYNCFVDCDLRTWELWYSAKWNLENLVKARHYSWCPTRWHKFSLQ